LAQVVYHLNCLLLQLVSVLCATKQSRLVQEMSLVCLAFLAQLVFASATSADSCPAAICGSSELGSSDDTQVLLQTPKAVQITAHSDADQHGPEGFGFKLTPSDFEGSMTFTAVVAVGGKIQGHGDLLSFVGNRLRGVSATPLVNPAHGFGGKYGSVPVYHLMTYGHGTAPGTTPDQGKPVTFKFLTKAGDFLDLKPALSAQTYRADGTVGDAKEPMVLTAAGAAQEDTGSTCADASQTDMNAWLATFGPGYAGLTCAQFKGWKQCNIAKGKCDKTCGEC